MGSGLGVITESRSGDQTKGLLRVKEKGSGLSRARKSKPLSLGKAVMQKSAGTLREKRQRGARKRATLRAIPGTSAGPQEN